QISGPSNAISVGSFRTPVPVPCPKANAEKTTAPKAKARQVNRAAMIPLVLVSREKQLSGNLSVSQLTLAITVPVCPGAQRNPVWYNFLQPRSLKCHFERRC